MGGVKDSLDRPMVSFTSRVDRIASELQNQINQGKLKAGDKLPSERNLCGQFGAGRTTIREALKSLDVRGLVFRRGRGMIVADPETLAPAGADLTELAVQVSIRQLYEVRKLIEVRVAGWAAIRATRQDIEGLCRVIDAASSKRADEGNPNRMFHDALARAVHNPALMQVYEAGRHLFFRLPFYWKLFENEEVRSVRAARHALAHRWHEHLLDAITQRDVAEAEGAMFQHLDMMEKDLLSRLPKSEDQPRQEFRYSHPLLSEYPLEKDEADRRSRTS
jgi:GntR family transcriptional repressor for pyruvate dehydrogenase complex